MLSDDFHAAMKEACRNYKTQKAFSVATGIHQSRISAYLTGRIRFEELSISTLMRLFPQMKINYFSDRTLPDENDEKDLRAVVEDLLQRVKALEEQQKK